MLGVGLALVGCAIHHGVTFRNGPPTDGVSSLLARDDGSLHIMFVHGIRANRAGGSGEFRAALCRRLPGCHGPTAQETVRVPLDDGDFAYLGETVWRNREEWTKSYPVLHRYVYANGPHPPVVVEEVNYWPLLVPLKCRYLVSRDAPLVGVSAEQLDVCAARGRFKDDEHYAWLSSAEADQIAAGAGVTGGGARLNKMLKTEIMDWGLSDAVISLGPMSDIIGRSIGASFAAAATLPLPPGSPATQGGPRFVVISESLGSFVSLDYYDRHYDEAKGVTDRAALTAPEPSRAAYGMVRVLDNADRLYFLANQVALLEFARLEPQSIPSPGALQEPAAPRGLMRWARRAKASGAGLSEQRDYGQLVAFHDPSDILTFEVPTKLGPANQSAEVHNVFLVNGPTYLGLFADPARAHTAHARNSCVLDIIFDNTPKGPCKVAPSN
jgi:hypothetical protein